MKQKIRDSRVQGTQNLVNSLKGLQKRPKTLICASAIGFYGDRGVEVLDENSSAGTGFLPEVCGECGGYKWFFGAVFFLLLLRGGCGLRNTNSA